MPTLSPRAIAHGVSRNQTYLLAYFGKDRYLIAVDDAVALRIVRKLSSISEMFAIGSGTAGPCAVFFRGSDTVVLPFPDGKAKTIKGADHQLNVMFVPEPASLHGVFGRSVQRFDVDRWTPVDGTPDAPEGKVVLTTLRGTYQRALRDKQDGWQPIVERSIVKGALAVLPDGSRCLLGAHGDRQLLVDLDGGNEVALPLDTIWGCAAAADRFFARASNKVVEIDRAGTVTDTGLTGEIHADRCLFSAGDSVFFLEGTHLHRYRDGAWTHHDVAGQARALGLS